MALSSVYTKWAIPVNEDTLLLRNSNYILGGLGLIMYLGGGGCIQGENCFNFELLMMYRVHPEG